MRLRHSLNISFSEGIISMGNICMTPDSKKSIFESFAAYDSITSAKNPHVQYKDWIERVDTVIKKQAAHPPLMSFVMTELVACCDKILETAHNGPRFYEAWIAIDFICLLPEITGGNWTIRELFGDALIFSGCSIIFWLGQTRDFNAGSHALKFSSVVGQPVSPNLANTIKLATQTNQMNLHWFEILRRYTQ